MFCAGHCRSYPTISLSLIPGGGVGAAAMVEGLALFCE